MIMMMIVDGDSDGDDDDGNVDYTYVEKRFSRTLSGDEDFLEIESHRATCLPLI